MEHIEQGISVFDANLKLVALNARFLELLGMPAELGEPGTDFAELTRFNAINGEYGEGDIEELVAERVAQARKFEAHSFDRVRPDGSILHITGTPLPEGGFVTVYTDVTKPRQREAELEYRVQARTEELRRNQARLTLIANEVPAGIALLDKHLVFKYANRGFAMAYGLNSDLIVGKKAEDVLSPATLTTALPWFKRALAGESMAFDLEADLPDHGDIFVRCYARPEISDQGEVTGFYLLTVNITRQRESDLALIRAQKMEALGTLSAGIAHDFNNLLTIILGNLVPLEDAMENEGLKQEYLVPAIAAASRGNDLTNRLLSLTKQSKAVVRPLRAYDAISNTLKILTASLPSEITLEGPEDPCAPWIQVDRGQLEMALINLAVNGSEAITGPGRIRFSCDETALDRAEAKALKLHPGRYCRIRVGDTGHGMSEEVMQRIFDPFYSRKPDKGSGLGLAMVYAFADLSGGAIAVSSVENEGSVFTLYLPAIDPQDDVHDQCDAIEDVAADLSSAQVLLVEDNPLVRDVVRRQVQAFGAQVGEAASAEEAMLMIEAETPFDLVLSDISLTGRMTGIDLRCELGKKRPELPVILMTAHGAADILGPDGGPGLVLQKPFRKKQLETALAHALQRTQ
nr:PAS-domain containing protein [Thalassovita mangrovi]